MYGGPVSKTAFYMRKQMQNLTELEARIRMHTLQIDILGILKVKFSEAKTFLQHSVYQKMSP